MKKYNDFKLDLSKGNIDRLWEIVIIDRMFYPEKLEQNIRTYINTFENAAENRYRIEKIIELIKNGFDKKDIFAYELGLLK